MFKVKPGNLTTPPRYKSRFVAKGYAQIRGIDKYTVNILLRRGIYVWLKGGLFVKQNGENILCIRHFRQISHRT